MNVVLQNLKFKYVLMVLTVLSILASLIALLTNINAPVLDSFGFRQTQTAISAYYIALGGPWFSYETPILGAPWSIPFEFPLFQILVAGLFKVGVPLDAAGRIMSYLFFLACLMPLRSLLKSADVPKNTFPILAVLFLSSPLYLFWSRSFLIETTALFFCISWLALFVNLMSAGAQYRWHTVLLAVVVGSIGGITKSTTLIPVIIFAFFWFVRVFWIAWRERNWSAVFGTIVLAGVVTIIPMAIAQSWVVWSDAVKSENEIGQMLTASALSAWNFGTIGQRLSLSTWATFYNRTFHDVFGYLHQVGLAIALFSLVFGKSKWFSACCAFAFLGTLLTLVNLHYVHSYYQVSIAIFVLLSVAVVLAQVDTRHGAVILMALSLSQVSFFFGAPYSLISADHTQMPEYRIALEAKDLTQPNGTILVVGHDWDSTIPYYSQRRAMMMPGWASNEQYEKILSDVRNYSGVVVCDQDNAKVKMAAERILLMGFSEVKRDGHCGFYRL